MPQISFNFPNINTSAQVGDIVYYSYSGQNLGGFNSTSLQNTKMLGPIISIINNVLTVEFNSANVTIPPLNSYISFVKDKSINTSSLLGYYASAKFVNNSTDKAELFSVGSEISLSSK